MLPERQRHLDFEGAVNFRDIGGYSARDGRRTRWGRLYRSDSLADLTQEDLTRLEALGVKTLIDFRLPLERLAKPNRLPPSTSIAAIELGFVPEGTLQMLQLVKSGGISAAEIEDLVTAQYRLFGVDHSDEYRRVFEVASAAENYPLLLHCTSGKDRTGFGIATLLLAVGVPLTTVLEDYEITNRYRRAVPQLFGPDTPPEVAVTLLSAQPKYLKAAFDEIDRVFGSFDAYLLKRLGVHVAVRVRLIELLTEPDDQAPRNF
jgi:protein-tyrosine phosphatase